MKYNIQVPNSAISGNVEADRIQIEGQNIFFFKGVDVVAIAPNNALVLTLGYDDVGATIDLIKNSLPSN